ncbi:MAG: hypothetical protein OEW17_04175 [Gemmatimonadota bacterium]|nr:hypothetical protein [Gemmatimonadota bacterium]MDH4347980.1 hypothetical protein [Gemmatimonadota bacterium]MDH5284569.1 hypothetical protein [Gemmatimonadota bacterium]
MKTSWFRCVPGAPLGVVGAALTLATGSCTERDRLTFPDPGPPGEGPRTTIDRPTADTTVPAGPGVIVTGYTRDPDGVDTVYFETEGGVSTFPPFVGQRDSVRFGIPITTSGQSGAIITVRVFGTDRLGNRGDTATRVLTVQ